MQVRSVPQNIVKTLLSSPSAPAWKMVLREGTVDYGVAVQAPIFSLHTQSSISTGDFSDVFKFAGYLRSIGIGFHQVLPPFRLGIGDICPYSAVSLKALEPAYVSILRLVEKNNPFFNAERVLTYIRENKHIISKLNSTSRVDYEGAMAFKYKVLLFFFNDTATTEIYPLSLHDALPICHPVGLRTLTWILVAMVGARSAAMGFN